MSLLRRIPALLALLLAACAAVQPISDMERRKISSVVINPAVTKVPAMSYLGSMDGMMFGALGAAAAAPTIEDRRKAYQAFVENSGIAIDKIVLEEVTAAIQRSGKFPLAARPGPGGAVIDISIVQYGFSIPHGFSSKLVPTLFIRCDMKDAAGKVVWTSSARVLPLGNPVEGVEPQVFQSNPKAMGESWRAAAKHVAETIVGGY